MPVRTRTNLVALIALLALVTAGGTAVAATAAKVVKNSVTSKSIKNNTVKSKDLKDGAVESVDVADGSLGSADLQDGSLASADVKDDGLTGADLAEGTLGTVPNATAVGGVQVTPLAVSLPSSSSGLQVLSEAGDTVLFDCTGAGLRYVIARSASGPPVLYTAVLSNSSSSGSSLGPNENVEIQIGEGQFTIAIVLPSGGSVSLDFTGIFETNASGPNDCFFRGTITRTP
jgi:hypothetical protein